MPGPGYTLDRKKNERGYEPGNCRWATDADQRRNKSTNVVLCFRGRSMVIRDWAAETGIKPGTLWYRIRVLKWPTSRALTTGVRPGGWGAAR